MRKIKEKNLVQSNMTEKSPIAFTPTKPTGTTTEQQSNVSRIHSTSTTPPQPQGEGQGCNTMYNLGDNVQMLETFVVHGEDAQSPVANEGGPKTTKFNKNNGSSSILHMPNVTGGTQSFNLKRSMGHQQVKKRQEIFDYFFQQKELREYIPPAAITQQKSILEREHRETEKFSHRLKESWQYVEEVIAFNKQRQCDVEKFLSEVIPKSFEELTFWSEASLVKFFKLHSVLDDEDDDDEVQDQQDADQQPTTSKKDASHPTPKSEGEKHQRFVDRAGSLSVKKVGASPSPRKRKGGNKSSDTASSCAGMGDGELSLPQPDLEEKEQEQSVAEGESSSLSIPQLQQQQNNMASSSSPFHNMGNIVDVVVDVDLRHAKLDDILSPGNEFAPIRQCFAPILRQSENIPKEFTLLLNAIQEIQRRAIPIEDELKESVFKLPVHVPFRQIAQHISRVLIKMVSGSTVETNFIQKFLPLMRSLKKQYQSMVTMTDRKEIYKTLEKECVEREGFQGECLQLIKDAVDAEQSMKDRSEPMQKELVEATDLGMEQLKKNARLVTADARSVVDQINNVEDKGRELMEGQEELHQQAMETLQRKMKQSETQQEKLLRQIRQLQKQLQKEQESHADMQAELLERAVQWEQMQTNCRQFLSACEDRRSVLKSAAEKIHTINDLIEHVQELVSFSLKECQSHISRTLAEESFRKLRVSKEAVDNTKEWYRALNDLLFLRKRKLEDIKERQKESWQTEYLLNFERRAAEEDVKRLEKAQERLGNMWTTVVVYLAAFQIPIPSLARVDNVPEVMKMRQHFAQVDLPDREKRRKPLEEVEKIPEKEVLEDAEYIRVPPVVPAPRLKPKELAAPLPPARAALIAEQ